METIGRLGLALALVVSGVGIGAVGGSVLFAQPEEQPCQATLSGRLVTVDLDTCESSTTTTQPVSTTSPTTTSSTSTTVAPSPTSTSPSTSSSTSPSTSTTLSPTTVSPPPGAAFSERFEDPSAFDQRFVYDVGNYVEPYRGSNTPRTDDYLRAGGDTPAFTHGDHNMACGDPATTSRTLDNADPDLRKYFWACLPGNDPAKGHLMTGFDTTGYTVVSFSPNQSFTDVTKVCWDINATEEGGGKWTNMIIVPEALYQQFAPRMDYVRFDFNNQNAPGDFNIQQADHPGARFLGVTDFRGTQFVYNGDQLLDHPGGDTSHTTTDKAARYQHCFERTDATHAKLTVQRPDGPASVYNVNVGSAWPTGPVRVIFQDEMYDPPKREGYDPSHVTWHWDNIQISAG